MLYYMDYFSESIFILDWVLMDLQEAPTEAFMDGIKRIKRMRGYKCTKR